MCNICNDQGIKVNYKYTWGTILKILVYRSEYGSKCYNLEKMEYTEKHNNKIEIFFKNRVLSVSYLDIHHADEFKKFVITFDGFLQNGMSILEIPYEFEV